EIVYCEDDYDETQPDVPCYVMNNSFYSPVNMNAINSDHSKCHICGEDLTNRRFYNHLFDQHGFTKQQCEMLKQQKKLEASKNRQGSNSRKIIKLHACGSCGLEYITKSGLTSHLAKSPSCSMQEEIVESSRGGTGASYNIVCPSYGCDKK
uniref:C2H2-type domain-containing protein n=1 Tax=Caenorhabditis japonica TaxID=281687 RepID=A0A8R1II71_CAEJA